LLHGVTAVSQIDTSAPQALAQFIATPHSALLGLKTFWEGIDIPGDKLRLVIITKLPFPNTRDPIIKARCEKAAERAFVDIQLPEMISDLRQGVGRLIRSKTDRGVIAILDSRLLTKAYKGAVLNSLGINKVLTDQARVLRNLDFLAMHST
jgi:Rad3-related DNA helicase